MSRAGLSNFATISPACEGGSVKKLNKFQTTNNFRFFSFFLVERSNQNISPLLSKMSVMVSETLKAFWAKNSRMQRMKIFTNQVINNAHQLQLLLFWPNTSVSAHHFTYTQICMYIHSPPPKKKQKQMQSSNQRMYTFFFFIHYAPVTKLHCERPRWAMGSWPCPVPTECLAPPCTAATPAWTWGHWAGVSGQTLADMYTEGQSCEAQHDRSQGQPRKKLR